MSKTKISEFSTTPGNNTDINGINIAEGCAPSGINNAIRELMSDLKEWQSGAMDVYVIPQGNAAAPGIQLYGDLDTGLYGYAANQLGVAVGGASAGYFSSAGWVGNVNGTITGDINATTIDTTNLEVTNIKAKDGTAAITIADSTGVVSVSTQLAVDNLNLSGNTLSSSDTNGNIVLAPNGTGDVHIDADTLRVGDSNANAIITTNGTGDLTLNTNGGSSSGAITIEDGVNGNINLVPNGTGGVYLENTNGTALFVRNSTAGTSGSSFTAFQNKDGAGNYRTVARVSGLTTSNGGNGSFVVETAFSNVLYKGLLVSSDSDVFFYDANGNQALKWDSTDKYLGINQTSPTATLDVVGDVKVSGTVNATTADLTNLEVTNIKAKDGTASATIADSTGVMTIASSVLTTADINGGTADGVVIGGSTAAAGTFTTATATTGNITTVNATTVDTTNIEVTNIKAKDGTASITLADSTGVASFTANPILSGGTANGVPYLNASKVLTTGSALTFDGTTFSINGGTNGSRFSAKGTGAFGGFDTGAATDGRIEYAYNGTNIFYTGIDSSSLMTLMARSGVSLAFGANGSEQMRLTSTGLGIGTSSPGSILNIKTSNGQLLVQNGTSSNQMRISAFNNAGNANAALIFEGYSSEYGRFDSSGNLGLGVTPSAWNSSFKIVETTNAAFFGQFNGTTVYVGHNAYNNGTNWIYKSTQAASFYSQASGAHYWLTAPSGTAGNAITFTQAMTLDASGNLLVGDTSTNDNATLFVKRAGATVGANTYTLGWFQNATGYKNGLAIKATDNAITLAADFAGSAGGAAALVFATNSTSTANNATERARITSGGILLVGTTGTIAGSDARLQVDSGSTFGAIIKSGGGAVNGNTTFWHVATSGDNVFTDFGTEASFTSRGSITYNRAGGLVAYNTASDYRAKDIIGPVQNPGATIDALKVYEGKMKGATQSRPMLVAHEAQEHAPYAVSGVKDEVNDDGTPKFQQMDVSSLVPLLLAEIQSLRARVAQLESKGA